MYFYTLLYGFNQLLITLEELKQNKINFLFQIIMKHKSEDYKISAVKYYIKNKVSMDKTCKIFDCKKTSLKRWINRYNLEKNIKRHNRKPISYKITKEQVKYLLKLLKDNEQITMEELVKLIKVKFTNFDITPQHLGKIIRDNNKTRKRTRHEHFPKIRYMRCFIIKYQ